MFDEQRSNISMSNQRTRLVIRTGCLNCRAKGIRCDPKNPQCQQNSSTEWITNRSVVRRQRPSPRQASNYGSAASSFGIFSLNMTWRDTTLRERESLHFFNVISAPELSGFLDTKFWQQLLPQATHLDHAIKHAVVALGASHEYALRRQASRLNQETDGLLPFGIRQCNKAITGLLRPSKVKTEGDIMRALTASILFASFESLSGNREGAIPHVVHSRRLLEQHKRNDWSGLRSSDFPVSLSTIEPLICHYEVQIGDYVYEDKPIGMLNTFNVHAHLDFYSLADARVSLEQAIANFGMDIYSLKEHRSAADLEVIAERKLEYTAWLQRWEDAFTAFLEPIRSTFSQKTLDGCRLIKTHHVAISTVVRIQYGAGESAWAEFTPDFRTIVTLITTIMDNLPKRGVAAQAPHLAYLSSTMGMTEPLYCAATRCTDAEVAEQARSLMKKLPLNEGVHSAWRIAFLEKTLCEATGKDYVVLSPSSTVEDEGGYALSCAG